MKKIKKIIVMVLLSAFALPSLIYACTMFPQGSLTLIDKNTKCNIKTFNLFERGSEPRKAEDIKGDIVDDCKDININREDVYELVSKHIAKSNFRDFYIEKIDSYEDFKKKVLDIKNNSCECDMIKIIDNRKDMVLYAKDIKIECSRGHYCKKPPEQCLNAWIPLLPAYDYRSAVSIFTGVFILFLATYYFFKRKNNS